MKLSDLQQIEHWSQELAKLHAALAMLKDGPERVELRFYRGEDMPDQAPAALIDVHDMEFEPIAVLARRRILLDIEEISAALKELGAEPDPDWKPKRHA